jgi:GNAT superfamily N-acetyltransferase
MTISISPQAPAQAAPVPPGAWCWVPIRSLAAHDRPAIQAHLLALDDADRYLRFGRVATNPQIENYVQQMDFALDDVYGVYNRKLELIALAHLAHLREPDAGPRLAEFGVSVSAGARGRGVGRQLFDLAVLRARNRGVDTLVTHALAGNAAMLHIVRAAGATIETDGRDATALLRLPPQDLASHLGAIAQAQVAEMDFNVKRHAHFFGGLLRLTPP